MPRVSKRRMAFIESRRRNSLKRFKKDEGLEQGVVEKLHPDSQVAPQPPAPSPPRVTNVSSAAFRHSLLQQKRESPNVSEDNIMIVMSLQRLKSILKLIKCDCGTILSTKITTNYFDCSVNLRCDECEKVVCYSEPRKCQRSNITEGNIVHVFHSLSEGYGQAGLSRISALMGCKEMTTFTFNRHAQFLYEEMNGFYKEQESVAQECVEKLYENEEKMKDSDGKLNVDVSFDGTWVTNPI